MMADVGPHPDAELLNSTSYSYGLSGALKISPLVAQPQDNLSCSTRSLPEREYGAKSLSYHAPAKKKKEEKKLRWPFTLYERTK